MRLRLYCVFLISLAVSAASAQVSSHGVKPNTGLLANKAVEVTDKPVVRVNGFVLTDRDLVREMYSIFPYGRQHNGFPKAMEGDIRNGALQMIVFEELVYQEALRRRLLISQARINQAMMEIRNQFSKDEYEQYLKLECQGSEQVLRQKVRRSLLIEALLKAEVQNKSLVTLVSARAYFDQHPQEFQRKETLSIQTISIIPPEHATPEVLKEASKRAEDALRQAKATKSYREFGLLAEKISDDDWHVNMGDRKEMGAANLPPPLVEAARSMKPGQVSKLLQFGPNYTLFRLNAHTPAGKVRFEEIKSQLRSHLQQQRYQKLRADLNQRLRKNAKVELLYATGDQALLQDHEPATTQQSRR